ncbi:hypothetical protein RIF29_20287 [Crotalaria pallida]|uniref:PWWP domain-containing protein n=1 Tax=Crotalaria pallida TaxID=3830 RepID=A0AAN9I7C0_CROPI
MVFPSVMMAVNSGPFDLNAELLDRENEVVGFNPTWSNVNVGVSYAEIPTGEGVVHDHKLIHGGVNGGVNGSVGRPVSGPVVGGFHMNHGFVGMSNGSGEGVFGEGDESVDRENENGLKVVDDGWCSGEAGDFSFGLVKNEDEKSAIEGSNGASFVYGAVATGKGIVFEGNGGVWNGLEHEKACKGAENSWLSTNVASKNEAPGFDNNLTEDQKEIKNAALLDLSTVVENGNKMKAAESLVTKDGLEDSHASEIATIQFQNGVPFVKVGDVGTKTESLQPKDLCLKNRSGPETSYELKQPGFQADAQAAVTQITVPGEGLFQNIQNEYCGLDLIVDFNSYRNMLEVDTCRESMFSEHNFGVSDLVWGKVMGHPWWPGQIFDPSAASENAKQHLKKDCYLIAYFGDQTFAWNDVSTIKPFQMHFSQMVKQQSNLENFRLAVDCALDEVSRRVEFGLSCPCIPEEVFSKVKTQVTINAGIQTESSRRNGGDRFMNAMSFEPKKLVNFVKSLAHSPLAKSDKLDFVMARAQLLAFNHSKGYSQLPEFPMLGGLLDYDMEIILTGEKAQHDTRPGFPQKRGRGRPRKIPKLVSDNDMEILHMREKDQHGLKTHLDFSQKRGRGRPSKKLKLVTDVMSEKSFCIINDEHALERKTCSNSITGSSDKKRKAAYNTSDDCFHIPRKRKLTEVQHVSGVDMLSQICLAATDPNEERHVHDMVYFFTEFRNFISLGDSASLEQEMSSEQMHAGESGVTPIEAVAPMTYATEPCNDSYWTDRIIQSISEEQPLSENKNGGEEVLPETSIQSCSQSFKSPPDAEISLNLGSTQQETDRNLGSEPSKTVEHLDESSSEFSPTALSLKFTDLDSIPPTTDLNKIFGRFGPLIESKTELLPKTKRAKVVFKRRPDAEAAFSSAGKYSIFGPALVSYRLKILPRIQEKRPGKRGRKSRKEKSSLDGAAV